MKKILFICMFLISCYPKEIQQKIYIENEIVYYKDMRTNTCYAGIGINTQYQSLTSVDCQSGIEQSAIKFYSK